MEQRQVAHGSTGRLEVNKSSSRRPDACEELWQMLNEPAPELAMHLRIMDEVASIQVSSAA